MRSHSNGVGDNSILWAMANDQLTSYIGNETEDGPRQPLMYVSSKEVNGYA
jgi:hypothetical protein